MKNIIYIYIYMYKDYVGAGDSTPIKENQTEKKSEARAIS